jgi:DNA anti-recombination protein RmuC
MNRRPMAFGRRRVRRYEDGKEQVSAIAAEAGMTAQALTNRARASGWKLRSAAKKKQIGTRETIARLKALLQQRLSELEGQIDTLSEQATAATSERDIRAMNTLVRTLEKVLELERKKEHSAIKHRKPGATLMTPSVRRLRTNLMVFTGSCSRRSEMAAEEAESGRGGTSIVTGAIGRAKGNSFRLTENTGEAG